MFGFTAAPEYAIIRQEIDDLADAHVAHTATHPGWSFPGRVWSASTPLDLPKELLVPQALARGYAEACPPTEPGQVCAKTGAVIPRGGVFPEGVQPPGTEGWTRPLALEPVLLGTLLGADGEIRWHLPVDQAPKILIDALLASEDEDFYTHHGVNLGAGARAVWVNLRGGGFRQGASTLTMQMVRMLTQRKEKTLARKVREAAQAYALDGYLGKEGVLQMYLDSPYLGQAGNQSVCGFRAASEYYFGIEPADLTLSQAATLVGILPAPGRFDPLRHPDAAKERRDLVLGRLKQTGVDVSAALTEPLGASAHPPPPDRYLAYLQATRIWLEANLPLDVVYGTGLDVFTALDIVAQERTDKVFSARVPYLDGMVGRKKGSPLQSASALIDPTTGALIAVYGGDLSLPTDFNRATQARRQPGSAFKPLVYALAFSQQGADGHPKYTAAFAVPNSPREFAGTGGWRPRNVGGEYSSTTCLANGLAWSQNIATASLLEDIGGPGPLIKFAQKFGFDTKNFPAEMGLALGQAEVTPLEMARVVATIVNGGKFADGAPVLIARDAAGTARYTHPSPSIALLNPEADALTRDLMRLVIEVGTGGASRGAGGFPGYPGPAIGKTGTTDEEKDLWFMGATPHYAGAVWLGYDQPQRIGAAASDLAAPLWGWWMHDLHAGRAMTDDLPGLVLQHRAVCKVTGLLPNATCPTIGAPFLPGTAPRTACPREHPPAPPQDEENGEAVEGEAPLVGPDGQPIIAPTKPPRHESLWKRKAREAEERAKAAGTAAPVSP